MLKKFLGKKSTAKDQPSVTRPVDVIDEDETIVINLSGSSAVPPEEVRVHMEPAPSTPSEAPPTPDPAPYSGDETVVLTTADLERKDGTAPVPAQTANAVAGFLCIVSENGRGSGYAVSLGRNKLGRASGNQIHVGVGDNMISQDNHVTIVADPKTRKFHVVPGDSTNLAYLNDEPVLQPGELTDKDILQVGVTSLIFVQYYGNYVDWD